MVLEGGGLAFATVLASALGTDAWAVPLPLGSSLAVKGSVTSTNSWPWEAPFSLKESLSPGGSLAGAGAIPFTGSLSFSTTPARSASLGGMLKVGRALAEAAWLGSETLGAASAWELE